LVGFTSIEKSKKMAERSLYMLFGGGEEPFHSIYKCSLCDWQFPQIANELRTIESDYRNHRAVKQFADHAESEHSGIALRVPNSDVVRLPGKVGEYQVTGTDSKKRTATLQPDPPAPPEAKLEDVEWRCLIYLT
jgi:hypothetical protein